MQMYWLENGLPSSCTRLSTHSLLYSTSLNVRYILNRESLKKEIKKFFRNEEGKYERK